MGALWSRIKRFSVWRVPNYFLEPSGAYLGERVEPIDRLNKIRSWAAMAIIIGTTVYYAGLRHLGTVTTGKDGVKTLNIGNHNPEGNWFLGLIVSVVIAVFMLPVVSLLLVGWTNRGARRSALLQLRWPVIAVAGWFAIFLAATPFIALAGYLQKSAQHMSFSIKAAAWLFVAFILILELTWIVKAIYLAATGMFRAEDGHPLLPVLTAPFIALSSAAIMYSVGDSGLVGVPGYLGTLLAWGGTITVCWASYRSWRILKGRYPQDFPFRNGPPRH